MCTLPKKLQSGNREEVVSMDAVFEFLKLVGVNVVSYYICKWLDDLF